MKVSIGISIGAFHKSFTAVALFERGLREGHHVNGKIASRRARFGSGAGRDVTRRKGREARGAGREAGSGRSGGCGAHAPRPRRLKVTLCSPCKCPTPRRRTLIGSFHLYTSKRSRIYRYSCECGYRPCLCQVEFMTAPCGRRRYLFIICYLGRRDRQDESICVKRETSWVS